MSEFCVVNSHKTPYPDVPKKISVCPYCGGRLYIKLDDCTWEEDDENPGLYKIEGGDAKVECKRGLRMGIKRYVDTHTDMPYVYWLPVCMTVGEWFNKHYRIDPTDWEGKLAKWAKTMRGEEKIQNTP